MTQFIHIDMSVFTDLHLSGNEAIIYSLVAAFCNNGVDAYVCKVDEFAASINMSERSARYTIDTLVNRGLLTKSRKQHGLLLRTAKFAEQDRQNLPNSSAKFAEQDRQNLPNPPFNNNNINNTLNNISENGKICRTETFPTYDILLDCFSENWRNNHGGADYPSDPDLSTFMKQFLAAITQSMRADNWAVDDNSCRTYFTQWFAAAWARCDQWHRDNWRPAILARHYTTYDQAIRMNHGQQSRSPEQSAIDAECAAKLEELRRSGLI